MKPSLRCNIILPFLATNSLSKLNFPLPTISTVWQQTMKTLPASLQLYFVSIDKEEIDFYKSLEAPNNIHFCTVSNWSDIWKKTIIEPVSKEDSIYIGLECNWRFKFNYLSKIDSEMAPHWTKIEEIFKTKFDKGTVGNCYQLGYQFPNGIQNFIAIVAPNMNPQKTDVLEDYSLSLPLLQQCYSNLVNTLQQQQQPISSNSSNETIQFGEYNHPGVGFDVAKGGNWKNALIEIVRNLDKQNNKPKIYYQDSQCVVIYDLFPKAKFHLLCIPKNKHIENVASISVEDLPLLRHMNHICEQIIYYLKQKSGLQFRYGFHSVPSLSRIHIHIISQDFESSCLKNKKHWNSFTTDYFFEAKQVEEYLATNGKSFPIDESYYESLLNKDLVCHKLSMEPSTVEAFINSHRFHFENMLQLESSKQCLYQFLSHEYSQDPLEFLMLEAEYRQSVIQYFAATDKLSHCETSSRSHPALTLLSEEKESVSEEQIVKRNEQVKICSQRMHSAATQIFHLYISEKSPKQLNLDSHLRKQLLKRKESLDSFDPQEKSLLYQFFCKVVDAMTIQLCTDCFPRFLKSAHFSQWLLKNQHLLPHIVYSTHANTFKFSKRDFFNSPMVSQKEFNFVDFALTNWQENWTLHCESEDKLSTLYINTATTTNTLFVGEEENENWYISKIDMIIPYNFEKLLLLNHFHHSIQFKSLNMINKELALNIPFYCNTVEWKMNICNNNHFESFFSVCATKRFSKVNQSIPERIIFVAKPIAEEHAIFFAHCFCKISNEITRVTIFQMIPLKSSHKFDATHWLEWDVQKTLGEREAIIEKMNTMNYESENSCERAIMSETYKKNYLNCS